MSIKNFENNRWLSHNQGLEFRHKSAIDLIKKGPVLDIGCGDGLLLSKLKEKNITCEGLDVSEKAIELCRQKNLNCNVIDLDVDELGFANDHFEYVVMLDVLEHFLDPEKILKKVKKVGKNIIISVPNFSSLPARLQVLFGSVPENNRPKQGHAFWFNFFVLKTMLQRGGLSVDEIEINTFWMNKPIVCHVTKFLSRLWPNIFGLSFVVLTSKITNKKND